VVVREWRAGGCVKAARGKEAACSEKEKPAPRRAAARACAAGESRYSGGEETAEKCVHCLR